jgi:hypothetical protein
MFACCADFTSSVIPAKAGIHFFALRKIKAGFRPSPE